MPDYKVDKINSVPNFRKLFKKLTPTLQKKVYKKTQIFKKNCFSSDLKTHKIKKNIWAFSITKSIRILFVFEKNTSATFVDIGPHSHVYKKK